MNEDFLKKIPPIKKCKTYDKPRNEVFKRKIPYTDKYEETPADPIKLYHATTDKKTVCEEGLKPRCELDGKCGLGGGTDQLVSFTTDEMIADDIAADLETVIAIANNEINTFDKLCNHLDEHDQFTQDESLQPCDIWKDAWLEQEKGSYIYPEKEDEQLALAKKYIKDVRSGYKLTDYSALDFLGKTKEEWYEYLKEKGELEDDGYQRVMKFDDRFKMKGTLHKGKEPHYVRLLVSMSPREVREAIYKSYKGTYLWNRQQAGGRENPVFFAVDIEKLSHLTPDDVGVVQVEGVLPESIMELQNLIKQGWNDNIHDLEYQYGHTGKQRGFELMSALKEIRLNPDRFNKLRLLD